MLALFFASLAFASFQANDISILLPLPQKRAEISALWGPRTGDGLLPRSVFDALPDLVTDLDRDTIYDSALHVVAVRIDPCFREAGGPCRRLIRLIWQPLVFEEGAWTTLDAAIHSFYELSPGQWESLERDLPQGAPGEKPGIHPWLAREGYSGPSWKKFQAILRYCNPVTLVRATAMTVNPLGNIWFFSGIDIQNHQAKAIAIPRVKDTTQGFFANVSRLDSPDFQVAMNPAPEEKKEFLRLLRDSERAKAWPEADLEAAVRESLSLENPRLTDPGTVDCASCHSARIASSWARRNFADWKWESLFQNELFSEGGKVFLPEPQTTGPNVLRMFGYFGREPVVSRRVVFETTEALKGM
jgi:hypothetical protein